MNDPQPDAVILHLSDLHFSGFLQNEYGYGEWNLIAKSHDYHVLLSAHAIITSLIKKYRQNIIIAITGDLTTAAEPTAYETVASFLFGKLWVSNTETIGLSLFEDEDLRNRVVIIPGNHDKWLNNIKIVTKWKQYPNRFDIFKSYFCGDNYEIVQDITVNNTRILFYLFDTNILNRWNVFNFSNLLGRGRVGKQQLSKMQLKSEKYNGINCLRIGLMHHSPVSVSGSNMNIRNYMKRILNLSDRVKVLNYIKNIFKLNLVICGHIHHPFEYPIIQEVDNKPWLSCAGSLTASSEPINSFKLYKVYRSGDSNIIEQTTYVKENNDILTNFEKSQKTIILNNGPIHQ